MLEKSLQILKFCICGQFWSKHLYACYQYLETVFDFTLFAYLQCTVHFGVTLQSKFWMSSSRIWFFVDNFGAWKMQFGSLKVLVKCFNFVLWVCYEPWTIDQCLQLTTAVGLLLCWFAAVGHGETDRQTLYHYIDPARFITKFVPSLKVKELDSQSAFGKVLGYR